MRKCVRNLRERASKLHPAETTCCGSRVPSTTPVAGGEDAEGEDARHWPRILRDGETFSSSFLRRMPLVCSLSPVEKPSSERGVTRDGGVSAAPVYKQRERHPGIVVVVGETPDGGGDPARGLAGEPSRPAPAPPRSLSPRCLDRACPAGSARCMTGARGCPLLFGLFVYALRRALLLFREHPRRRMCRCFSLALARFRPLFVSFFFVPICAPPCGCLVFVVCPDWATHFPRMPLAAALLLGP